MRKYYALAAPLAALGGAPLRYASSTFGMSDNGVMKYLISDHLPFQGASRGSTVAITDNAGNVVAETRYAERSGALRHFHVLDQVAEKPFGEPRTDVGSITQTDKTFTGQRDVPDTGLMDYRARMYSPWLGRFIQPDTVVPGAGNSQAWNRFSYGLNNPVRYIDPSGHKACVDWDKNGQCVADPDWHGKNNPLPEDPYKKGKNGKGVKGGNRFGGQVTISRANFPEIPDYSWPTYYSDPNGISQYNATQDFLSSHPLPTDPFGEFISTTDGIIDLVDFYKDIPPLKYIGFGLDFVGQINQDTRNGLPIGQTIIRGIVVGAEQLGIGLFSTYVALELGTTSFETVIGPVIAVGVFFEMNGVLSYLANEVNRQFLFPVIEERIDF